MKFFDGITHFMDNRNGNDNLNRFLSVVTLIMLVVSIVTKGTVSTVFFYIAVGILICEIIRMMSRNLSARQAENEKYLEIKDNILNFRSTKKTERSDRTHIYFKCPDCKKQLRVPKGKGKIEVRCPKCGRRFIKHT